jgi:hypothetical protein
MKKKQTVLLATSAIAFFYTAVSSQSTISPTEKHAWGENIGWCDFHADGTNGVVVTADYLSGYAWLENVGWLFLGDIPSDGTAYTQTAGDTGVNNDGAGNLSGYAWGENVGWVVFNPAGSGQRVTLGPDGQFAGHAWGENVGWIAMNSGHGVKSLATFPPARIDDWMLMK